MILVAVKYQLPVQVEIYLAQECLQFHFMLLMLFSVVIYNIEVYTGKQQTSPCSAKVYILLAGTKGDSGKRRLYQSAAKTSAFSLGNVGVVCVLGFNMKSEVSNRA